MAAHSSASPAAPVREQHQRFDITENTQCMIDSLSTFKKDETLTDLTLESSGKSFHCHKVILAAASEYFKAALTSGFKETHLGKIKFDNIDPEILEIVVKYIYGQKVTLKAANVLDLHSASHLLQIDGLIKITKAVMVRYFRESSAHQSFLDFPLPHLLEYISDSRLEVRNEDEVYKAVMRWIRHDLLQREHFTADLMAHVRLPYCTRSFFCQVIMLDNITNKYCQDILRGAVAIHSVPSFKSITEIKPRESSKTIGLEEHSVIKYITKEEGVMLSSRTDKHEYSLGILGELPNIDQVSEYSVCASDTTVVITGGATGTKPLGSSFSWSLDTRDRTWSQMPKLPHVTYGHSSIIIDSSTFTRANNNILMLEPKAEQWKVLMEEEDIEVVDGNSKYLLMRADHDVNEEYTYYYLFDRIEEERIKLNKPCKAKCLLKFIDDKLLALSQSKHQFRSFFLYDFTKKVWKRAGFVQVQCDGVDVKSKVCVWKENLVLTYPKGVAIFNPDTAILRHFISWKIDNYGECHIFPIFVSDSD